ncbi:MAG: ubiquinone biosynthesis accessory factor UbiK [bacterium]
MFDAQKLDELSRKVSDLIPSAVQDVREDFHKNVKMLLQGTLAQMDIVSREEFDVQTKVLAKTRKKLQQLEQQVSQLEADKKAE